MKALHVQPLHLHKEPHRDPETQGIHGAGNRGEPNDATTAKPFIALQHNVGKNFRYESFVV